MALEWIPAPADPRTRLLGYAVITGPRDRTSYAVTELPIGNGWTGRGFLFSKVGGKGTDPSAERYCVFVGTTSDGPTPQPCECRGSVRWGWCFVFPESRRFSIPNEIKIDWSGCWWCSRVSGGGPGLCCIPVPPRPTEAGSA